MDTIALTYRELAIRFGIKPESARKTAQRKRWRRSVGNDGTIRVHVPLEALPVPPIVAETVPVHGPSRDAITISSLEAQVAGLRELVEAERRRADEWKTLAERPWWKRFVA